VTGGLERFVRRTRSDLTLRRETDVMGLTVCIAMLAALTAGNDHSPHTRLNVLTLVWGTTLGLAFTHWFALSFSVHLVPDPRFTYSPRQLLGPQIAMAVLVAVAASIVVLLIPQDVDRLEARITAALFLAVLVVGVTIATVKWFVG
jgi:hypothetical protein